MTTRGFGALFSAVARAMTEVRSQHCQPSHYRPTETQRGSSRCIKALFDLDAKGALAQHGISGRALQLLDAAAVRLEEIEVSA